MTRLVSNSKRLLADMMTNMINYIYLYSNLLTVRFRAGRGRRRGRRLVARAARCQRRELAQVQQRRRRRVAALAEHRMIVATSVEARQVAHTCLETGWAHEIREFLKDAKIVSFRYIIMY